MKYLTDYMEQAQTDLFDKIGAMWAFSNDQLTENPRYNKETKYVSLGSGLVCPKDKVTELLDGLDKVVSNGIAQDMEENGKDAIINRELDNHEAYYTGSMESTVRALKSYPITKDEIKAGFHANLSAKWEQEEKEWESSNVEA